MRGGTICDVSRPDRFVEGGRRNHGCKLDRLLKFTSPRLRGEVEIRNGEFRVRGILPELSSWTEPLTPTLSPRRRAGRGGSTAGRGEKKVDYSVTGRSETSQSLPL